MTEKALFAAVRHASCNEQPQQPAAQWVGLTVPEMVDLWRAAKGDEIGGIERYTRAIEAKLREKNAKPAAPTSSERVLIDGVEYAIPAAVAAELLRLHLQIRQPAAPAMRLTNEEHTALARFNETCEDDEGYDVPKPMMRRLARIGVVYHTSRGIYGITDFGHAMLAAAPDQKGGAA